ncbi:MAG: PAS domain S-box protein [Bacteroidetes bacterium]|nr:PAS domain S-box protein [Bacteroidota bacterium]
MKMKINTKMLLFILSTTIIIFVAVIGYVTIKSKKMALDDAIKIADSYANQYANYTKAKLNVDMDISRTMAYAFKGYKDIPVKQRIEIYNTFLHNIIIDNENYISVWANWQLTTIDSSWTEAYGRMRYTYYRENEMIKNKVEKLNTDGDILNSAYYKMKVSKLETVMDPYPFSYTGSENDQILETSVCVPILDNNKFVGLAGLDLSLDRFKSIINSIRPFEGSYAYLIANNGALVTYPDEKMLNKKLSEILPDDNENYKIESNVQDGKKFSYFSKNKTTGKEFYISHSPIYIGKSITPWSLAIAVPLQVIMHQALKNYTVSIFVGLLGLIILSVIILIISKNITLPLQKTTKVIKQLALGDIDKNKQLAIRTGDEIEEISDSVNSLIVGLNKTSDFATHIGNGNLDAKFEIISDKDILGKSLIEMRNSLQKAKEEDEKRKIEDEKIKWSTQGLAKFGEILRQNNDNIETLSFNIIKNLVNYLGAAQGAFYIKTNNEEDETFYELSAAIAYDRKKNISKKIKSGEGLVGRCVHEKLTIYMIDVPKDYVRITSGLGEANPRCLLLVPLKLNDDVLSVVEIISFYEIEKYKINFVEKVGESIASTISSVKINERTALLLKQSQQQGEELAAQEEEMRQNLEELQATQEDAARREGELSGLWEALSMNSSIAIFDMSGNIIDINDKNLEIVGSTREQMLGKNLASLASEAKDNPVAYKKFWEDLKMGKSRTRIFSETLKGRETWTSETYTPIHDKSGKPIKILNVGTDITQSKKNEIETNDMLEHAFNKISKHEETEKDLKIQIKKLKYKIQNT